MLSKLLNDYDSEEDQNYEPTAKQQKEYLLEHQKKKLQKREPSRNVHELYLQMKKQTADQQNREASQKRMKTAQQLTNVLQLATNIMNSQSIKPNKRITFAGKEYLLNEETGQLDLIEKTKIGINLPTSNLPGGQQSEQVKEQLQIKNRHISFQYLNHIMQAIYYRSKKINAIGKSKLDWNGFVKQEGIEDDLRYNRKGGEIQNMQFMKRIG